MRLDRGKLSEESLGEGIRVGKAGKCRRPAQLVLLVRQNMGLLVADHLQPVLDPAQEKVSFDEILSGLRLDPAASRQRVQSFDGAAQAELRMTAAGNELLGLGEELDIADATAPELDVVAGDGNGAVALMGVHPPLHGVDVGDRREVEIFAPDEGCKLAQELFAGVDIAGNDARLDQGGAL